MARVLNHAFQFTDSEMFHPGNHALSNTSGEVLHFVHPGKVHEGISMVVEPIYNQGKSLSSPCVFFELKNILFVIYFF